MKFYCFDGEQVDQGMFNKDKEIKENFKMLMRPHGSIITRFFRK